MAGTIEQRGDKAVAGICSPLRHIDPAAVSAAAQAETRNREVHLPPVSVYRWWARRTDAVNGAIIDAVARDHNGESLLVADPFAGGGIIPLAAVTRGHQAYAQDLNPWAAYGLVAMLSLPDSKKLTEAGRRLAELADATTSDAYSTSLAAGSSGVISHTIRVAEAACTICGYRQKVFPHALISLMVRKERKDPRAFLACPRGHVFQGRSDSTIDCPECSLPTNPGAAYTKRRTACCPECHHEEQLQARAKEGDWRWIPVLVERTSGKARELAIPTAAEVEQASEARWSPIRDLGKIPEGQETSVLRRHGFDTWADLYPARQRVVTERLLALAPEATSDDAVLRALELAIVGTTEMAGHLSRWDRYYLKNYESMAGHRFNFTTLTAELNVWGAEASGRGTVTRRLRGFVRASNWIHERMGRDLRVAGPLSSAGQRNAMPRDLDVLVAEGSSERTLVQNDSIDVVVTDPPYHDDVQYSELALPLCAWADLSRVKTSSEALVNAATGQNAESGDYEALLELIFTESHRALKSDGHLIFSYANREPAAWVALFTALKRAGFRAAGYQLVHSENETDYAKREVRACTLDFVMDLVPAGEAPIRHWIPAFIPNTPEGRFLGIVADQFLRIDDAAGNWQPDFERRLRESDFLS